MGFNAPPNNVAIDVFLAYDTFYRTDGNSAVICPDGIAATSFVLTNSILNAPGVATVGQNALQVPSTAACTADTNIEFPQSTPFGTAVIAQDPSFVNATSGDFHLMATSPAIDDAKVIANDSTQDFDGTSRPQGARNDLGAFEYH